LDSAYWSFCARQAAAPVAETVTEPTIQGQDRGVDLLRRISAGDRAAFTEFYDLHAALFFSVAVRILGDPKEAEDVIQDVFIQIWEKAGSFDPKLGKASTWGISFVRHKAIDRIRSAQRRFRLVEDATAQSVPQTAEVPNANESLCGRERAAAIRSAVTGLPREQRQAIELAFFGGLTQNEISEQLGEPLGTVKARIRRGMLKLREILEGRL
jgi:RNA polymerase sigma-70 factor (ECF subfamily)